MLHVGLRRSSGPAATSKRDITVLCNAAEIRDVHEAPEKTLKFRCACASHSVFSSELRHFFFFFFFKLLFAFKSCWRVNACGGKTQIISSSNKSKRVKTALKDLVEGLNAQLF